LGKRSDEESDGMLSSTREHDGESGILINEALRCNGTIKQRKLKWNLEV